MIWTVVSVPMWMAAVMAFTAGLMLFVVAIHDGKNFMPSGGYRWLLASMSGLVASSLLGAVAQRMIEMGHP